MKKATAFLYQVIILAWKINPFKVFTRNVLLALKAPMGKFYTDLRYRGVFNVPVNPGSFWLYNPATTTIENEIFWRGFEDGWESQSISLWKKLCAASNYIFDIGANSGVFAIVAGAVNADARIFAFEPSVKTFALLQKNKGLNPSANLIIEKTALSNITGALTFYDTVAESEYNASLNRIFYDYTPEGSRRSYQVHVTTLDNYIAEHNLPGCDLLKIDVELHEPEVIEGMKKTLHRYRPSFLIEILSDEIGQRVQRALTGLNYLFYNIDENKGPVLSASLTKSSSYNYLVCMKEVAVKLGLPINKYDNVTI